MLKIALNVSSAEFFFPFLTTDPIFKLQNGYELIAHVSFSEKGNSFLLATQVSPISTEQKSHSILIMLTCNPYTEVP